ncbi:MAG: glycine cleavage system protein H [Planctomycetes bacterium]|nr:glycine cleavage system protein H [Planctomycetota bacterium]
MRTTRVQKYDWLRIGVALALVCIALPALAALVFFARFVVLAVAVPAIFAGLLLSMFSPRFRTWLVSGEPAELCYKGLRLASDVAVAAGHAWARPNRDEVVVGTDDLAPTVLGPVSSVELPEVGRWFQRGEPIARLRRGSRMVVLRAPVSGVVVSRNDALHWRPQLVNDVPYADGWLVRLRSEVSRAERAFLRHGRRARDWFCTEVDRLVGLLGSGHAMSHAVADGGALVGHLHDQIDEPTWQQLCSDLFDRADEPSDALP